MEHGLVIVLRIRIDFADALTGCHIVAGFYINMAQVAVDRQVVTMSYDDTVIVARDDEDACYHAIKDGTGFRPARSLDIDTVVVRTHMPESLMLVFSKVEMIRYFPLRGKGVDHGSRQSRPKVSVLLSSWHIRRCFRLSVFRSKLCPIFLPLQQSASRFVGSTLRPDVFLYQLLPQIFFFFVELLYFRFLFRFFLLQFPAFLLASIEQGYFIRTRLPQFFRFYPALPVF